MCASVHFAFAYVDSRNDLATNHPCTCMFVCFSSMSLNVVILRCCCSYFCSCWFTPANLSCPVDAVLSSAHPGVTSEWSRISSQCHRHRTHRSQFAQTQAFASRACVYVSSGRPFVRAVCMPFLKSLWKCLSFSPHLM